MKVLVVDSHKSTDDSPQQNLHWQNAKIIADALSADLIWSYVGVNDNIKSGYDAIVFVHASPYAFTDYEWIKQSPEAKLFYVTNEYNLGEPRTLWMAAKEGRKYSVIANHDGSISKVVKKYVDEWHNINLNALVFDFASAWSYKKGSIDRSGCVYYGSFRKDRAESFRKYIDKNITLSTHRSNVQKFQSIGCDANFVRRLKWKPEEPDLDKFACSLYIEDEVTHRSYNHLANRFYEALNHGTFVAFDSSCEQTISKSGYDLDGHVVECKKELFGLTGEIAKSGWEWDEQTLGDAAAERGNVINEICRIVCN